MMVAEDNHIYSVCWALLFVRSKSILINESFLKIIEHRKHFVIYCRYQLMLFVQLSFFRHNDIVVPFYNRHSSLFSLLLYRVEYESLSVNTESKSYQKKKKEQSTVLSMSCLILQRVLLCVLC